MMVLVNGSQTEYIRVLDRGLMYGDGLFRTLLIRAGRPVCWQRHYIKLRADCAALGIVCPPADLLLFEMGRLIEATPSCVLKIIVTRGESKLGYAVSDEMEPTRILLTNPIPQYPPSYYSEGIRMHLCSIRLAHQPRLAGIKHLNRLENVLARQEWNDPGIAEGLLLDMEGNVIEGTMTNLFVLRENVLYTPELGRCGVAGVQRARIQDHAGRLGLTVKVEDMPLIRIYDADEVVLCNSVIGTWQVRELAGNTWQIGNLAASLRGLLDDEQD